MQSMVFAVHGNRFFLWLVEEGGILKKKHANDAFTYKLLPTLAPSIRRPEGQ